MCLQTQASMTWCMRDFAALCRPAWRWLICQSYMRPRAPAHGEGHGGSQLNVLIPTACKPLSPCATDLYYKPSRSITQVDLGLPTGGVRKMYLKYAVKDSTGMQ